MRKSVALLLTTSALLLSSCGLSGTNAGGYIVGNGEVIQYPESQRGAAATLNGELLDGKPFDAASIAGKIAVLNVWGAWCGACRAEASLLQDVHKHYGMDVSFLGIDVRDSSPSTAMAYERSHGVTYPSIFSTDGKALLGIPRGKLPGTIPATIVLDADGRVAAVVRGALSSRTTLIEVVDCVVAPENSHCSSSG